MKTARARVLSTSVLFFAALGCGAVTAPGAVADVESTGQDIVGGVLTAGDPAVVALAIKYGSHLETYCTGTLIAPQTVLTAAHCIQPYGAGLPYVVMFGASASSATSVSNIAAQYKDPLYNQSSNDFGVVKLAAPVTKVAPLPWNKAALGKTLVGQSIRHVGYGVTTAGATGTSGVKHEVTYTVKNVTSALIESGGSGKQTCNGDSGGPAFMTLPGTTTETLVGVVSFGDQNCSYYGADGRVDLGAQWIKTTMDAWEQPTCAADGRCLPGCTPVDPDCACAADGQCTAECVMPELDPDCPKACGHDGVCATEFCPRPDDDCVAAGASCDKAEVCKSRLCVSDAQHPQTYCSLHCAADADCGGGLICAAGTCAFPQKPEKHFLELCTVSDFCVASTCTGPQGGNRRCVALCNVSSDCESQATCEAGQDGLRFCRPPQSVVSFTEVILDAAPTEQPALPAAAGCSSTNALTPAAAWMLFALFVPLASRRRAWASASRSR